MSLKFTILGLPTDLEMAAELEAKAIDFEVNMH